jgi:hypothetical protein
MTKARRSKMIGDQYRTQYWMKPDMASFLSRFLVAENQKELKGDGSRLREFEDFVLGGL